jgi:penicillin-binding protein 1A
MVALDPRTGDIRALVGGRRYERATFNRAIAARRQPGSAFKPFVYAAALAAGYSPASLVDDTPVEVQQQGRIWTPANYGGEYQGTVTLRRALMRSSNAATVRVSRALGEPAVIAVARRNGITSPLAPLPAIALGALEVTPLELVAAYAPFSNGGYRVAPRLVRRIETPDGSVLWSRDIARTQVMDPRDAYQLTSMLRSVVDRGTGSAVRGYGVKGPVAGKTGTTNDGTDVWFVGYTPTVVAGFWFGYDKPRSISHDANGGRLAAPAWAEFYTGGWKEKEPADAWRPPDGLASRVIDAETGMLANEWCPITQREYFKPGTEPRESCSEHYPLPEAEPFEVVLQREAEDWAGKLGKRLKKIFKF